MAGFWDSIQSFIPETDRTKMFKAENALRMRALQREEEAAAREEENLLRRQGMANFATSPSLEAVYPEFIAQGQQRNALDRADPAAALGRLESKLYPAAPEEYTLTPGAKRMRGQETVAENIAPVDAPKAPAEVEMAKWMFGGDENAARAYLRNKNAPASGAAEPNSPLAKAQQDLKNGFITQEQYDLIATKETALPAGSGDKTPQKFKDATAAIESLDGTVSEYEKLLNKVGTEYWDAAAAARLESLETQMKFGIKGLEQTGALDRGSVEVMAGMIPAATGMSALDPRGTQKAKAKLSEFKSYKDRMRKALTNAYGSSGASPSKAGATGTWSIVKED